jgi:hypothetical protein
MPAKTRSPRAPKVLSIQERFKAHLEAAAQCEKWAKKGIELVAAGRIAEAKVAEDEGAPLHGENAGAGAETRF